ncbi:MAG: hypothetical protein AB1689_13015 [Thermodesulfobacteriota bacterium]
MDSGKQPAGGAFLVVSPGVTVEPERALIDARDLVPSVLKELQRRGEVVPGDERLAALCRLMAGYLRTTPVQLATLDETIAAVVAGFVAAWPGWWTHDYTDYGRVAGLLDDAFHQREPVPSPTEMDVLHRLTVGLMRSRQMPPSHAAQLAMADWVATLYLAGASDW